MPQGLKEILRRFHFMRMINAFIKSWEMKRSYGRLCRYYRTPSILEDGRTVTEAGKSLLDVCLGNGNPASVFGRMRVVFVGTDWEQDRSGTVLRDFLVFLNPIVFKTQYPRDRDQPADQRGNQGNS